MPDLTQDERRTARDLARIKRINDVSRYAKASCLGMLAYLTSVFLTILQIEDADHFRILRIEVPWVEISLSTKGFFFLTPALGSLLYAHLHMSLLKIWKPLSELRSCNTEGLPISDQIHAWVVNDWALALRGADFCRNGPLSRLANVTTLALVWWVGPTVLCLAWWRSMPAHDEVLTLWLGVWFLFTIFVGAVSWNTAESLLRPSRSSISFSLLPWSLASALTSAVIVVSWARTEGGLDHYARVALEFWESRNSALFASAEARDAALARQWWLPELTDLSIRISPAEQWNPLAKAHLEEEVIADRSPSWQDYDLARRHYREDWCRRGGHQVEVCAHDEAAASSVEKIPQEYRTWCASSALGYDAACAKRARLLEDRFAAEWRAKRDSQLLGVPKPDLSDADLRFAHANAVQLDGAILRKARLDQADLQGAHLEGVDLAGARLEGANLSQARLEHATFTGASLVGAQLAGARLEASTLEAATLDKARLTGAQLRYVNFKRARLDDADLSWSVLSGANFKQASLKNAILFGADLNGVQLHEAQLERTDLSESWLQSANLTWTWMKESTLRNAHLEHAILRDARLEGATLANAWLDGAVLENAYLQNSNLTAARLKHANLRHAYLQRSDLTRVRLDYADLTGAQLTDSILIGAQIHSVMLGRAKLMGADLRGAVLSGVDLTNADFRNTTWAGAKSGAALALAADLRGARNLSQTQIDQFVGNENTLLPSYPNERGESFHVWSCWQKQPGDFHQSVLLGANPKAWGGASAERARGFLCGPGNPRRKTGTPLPLDAPYPPGHPLANRP